MSVFGSKKNGSPQDSTGQTDAASCPDPIARNPRDVDGAKGPDGSARTGLDVASPETGPEQNAISTQVSRRDRVPVASVVAPGSNYGSPANAPSGGELLSSILRYKWTIVIISILVSAPMIAGIWTQITPRYRGRAEIRIQPVIPQLVFRMEDNGAIPRYESFVNTQVAIIRSPNLLQRVLLRKEVQETDWYQNPPEGFLARLLQNHLPPEERLRESLSVKPRRHTEITDVSFADVSRKEAKVILNAVLNQYIIDNQKKVSEESTELYTKLLERRDTLQSTLDGQSEVLARLRRDLGTGTPEELISGKRVRLDTMKAELAGLRQNIDILLWEKTRLSELHAASDSNAPATAAEHQRLYHEDAEWVRLDLDIRTIQHQITNSIYGPNHPAMRKLKNTLAFAEGNRQQREGQLEEQWDAHAKAVEGLMLTAGDSASLSHEQKMRNLEYELDRANKQRELLETELNKEQGEFDALFASAQLLAKESKELNRKSKLLEAVEQRIDQKDMEKQVRAQIEVLTRAFVPSTPSEDRRIVFTVMSLVCGLALGGGAAFLRASRDQTIHHAMDMPQPVQVPFLGHVPLVQPHSLPGKRLCEELERNQSHLTESVRILRTALLKRLESHSHATVLVTSADEGTGKSSFTMLLGQSIAQAGRKILLIDADFYKMTLSKRFGLIDRPGFTESLSNKVVNDDAVITTKTPNLDVMPAGEQSSVGAAPEEIANGAFKACVSQLLKRYGYDIILVDSSPILPVADATILAGQVDGTIMVERENVSLRTHVANALSRLNAAGGRLLGTVFVGSSRPEHYGYGYGYGYGQYGTQSRRS